MMDEEQRYSGRELILDTARECVTQDRNKSYGEPDEDFQRIAAIASAMGFRVLRNGDTSESVPLTGSDVARFMIALKLSRLAWMPTHQDSWTDIAGYAACGYETATLEAERASGEVTFASATKETRYLRDVTGHSYDGCPVCVVKRQEFREALA